MIKIVILGTGNVAGHLFDAFYRAPFVQIVQVVGRDPEALVPFAKQVQVQSNLKGIADAEVYIIAVSDRAIAEVGTYLAQKKGLVVHTSGSAPMDILSGSTRKGVFYPLQTFTKGKKVSFKDIPLCVEAATKKDLELLHQLGNSISESVMDITTDQRKTIHLAAVFANNFTNHMYHISAKICAEKEIPFEILMPLIQETVHKIKEIGPSMAQTGPAKRGDGETMEQHLALLKNMRHKEIYSLLSSSIKEEHG